MAKGRTQREARQQGVTDGGYRILANHGTAAHQEVPHFHLHLFGGRDLGGAGQTYLYFVVAQDGSWLLKRREGNGTQDVGRGVNAAVKKPDASGKSVNALEVRVGADKIDYVVNGTVVQSSPKAGVKTDGIYGFRINHLLEVGIEGLAVSK